MKKIIILAVILTSCHHFKYKVSYKKYYFTNYYTDSIIIDKTGIKFLGWDGNDEHFVQESDSSKYIIDKNK